MTILGKLTELESKARAATPGPRFCVVVHEDGHIYNTNKWNSDGGDEYDTVYTISPEEGRTGWETDGGCMGYGIPRPDAEYLAAVDPATILDLCVALRKAVETLEWYASLDNYEDESCAPFIPKMTSENDWDEVDLGKKARAVLREIGVVK